MDKPTGLETVRRMFGTDAAWRYQTLGAVGLNRDELEAFTREAARINAQFDGASDPAVNYTPPDAPHWLYEAAASTAEDVRQVARSNAAGFALGSLGTLAALALVAYLLAGRR